MGVQHWLRLRIYIGESDRYRGKPLYMYLLELFRRRGLKGATVIRGMAGYGSHSMIHTAGVLRLSEDLPVIVEVVDEEDAINSVLDEVKAVVKEGLVTLERVEVLYYGSARQG
jgi:PII-like signaling protein